MSIFDIHSTVLADYRGVTPSFIWFFEEQFQMRNWFKITSWLNWDLDRILVNREQF